MKPETRLKWVSLLLGVIAWAAVMGLDQETVTTKVPVRITLPHGLTFVEHPKDVIQFEVIGSRFYTRLIQGDSVEPLLLDFTHLNVGEHRFNLGPELLTQPAGLKVQRITPSELTFRLEKLVTKKVPLVLATRGNLPNGRILLRSRISPEHLEINGPASLVQNFNSLITEPVDLASLISSGDISVSVSKSAFEKKGIIIEGPSPVASFTLKEDKTRAFVRNVEVSVKKPSSMVVKVASEDIDIYINGEATLKKGFRFRPFIDLNDEQTGIRRVPIRLPEDQIGLVSKIVPASVVVTIVQR